MGNAFTPTNWNTGSAWGAAPTWNMGAVQWAGASSSSSSSSNSSSNESVFERREGETLEAYWERIKKYREENAPKIAELEAQQKQVEEAQKAQQEMIKQGEFAKADENDPNGVLKKKETKKDFKKLSFWQKLGRGISGLVSGAIETGKNMLGIESLIPPKINWKQLGKAALCVAGVAVATCIPVVGPLVVPALTTIGLAVGVGQVGTGVYKMATTDDPEEFDRYAKMTGEGTVVAGLSMAGIRGSGGFTGMWKNAMQTAKSQSLLSLNCWKENFITKPLGKVKDFFSGKGKEAQFTNASQQTNTSIEARISEIDTQLSQTTSTLSEAEKAQLISEKTMLQAQQNQLNLAKTREDFMSIKKDTNVQDFVHTSKDQLAALKSGKEVTFKNVAGQDVILQPTRENIEALKATIARNENLMSNIKRTIDLQDAAMKRQAFFGRNRDAVSGYTGAKSYTGKIWSFYKPGKLSLSPKAGLRTVTKTVGTYFKYEFKPFNWYFKGTKNGTFTPLNIEHALTKNTESGTMIGGLLTSFGIGKEMFGGEQAITMEVPATDEKGQAVLDKNGNPVMQQVVMTKDTLAQLQAEQKKLNDTLNELKEQQSKLERGYAA